MDYRSYNDIRDRLRGGVLTQEQAKELRGLIEFGRQAGEALPSPFNALTISDYIIRATILGGVHFTEAARAVTELANRNSKPVTFEFNNHTYTAYPSDPVSILMRVHEAVTQERDRMHEERETKRKP